MAYNGERSAGRVFGSDFIKKLLPIVGGGVLTIVGLNQLDDKSDWMPAMNAFAMGVPLPAVVALGVTTACENANLQYSKLFGAVAGAVAGVVLHEAVDGFDISSPLDGTPEVPAGIVTETMYGLGVGAGAIVGAATCTINPKR